MFDNYNPNVFKMLVIVTSIFLSSCFEKNIPAETEKYYFDIKGFFENQASVLNEQKIVAEKYLINQTDTQRLVLTDLNWSDELAPFINNDINKPAWKGSYKIDSLFENDKIKSITYKSLEKKLPVNQIQIHFQGNDVNQIFIENATKNYVYNSVQVLSYYSNKGYSIEGEQDIILGKDLHYKVFVNFIKD